MIGVSPTCLRSTFFFYSRAKECCNPTRGVGVDAIHEKSTCAYTFQRDEASGCKTANKKVADPAGSGREHSGKARCAPGNAPSRKNEGKFSPPRSVGRERDLFRPRLNSRRLE